MRASRYLAALAIASLATLTACADNDEPAPTGNDQVVEVTEQSDSPSAQTPATTGAASPSPSPTPSPSQTAASGTYTMAQVESHNSAASCWTVVNGTVYDVTRWISQHPGGADRIIGLCGKDGTSDFSGQHSGASEPQQRLASFKIGTLAN